MASSGVTFIKKKYSRLQRAWRLLIKARFYRSMRKVSFNWMSALCHLGYCCTAEPHFMLPLLARHACRLACIHYTHTCTLKAVCAMIWWKTWAGRSRIDHWFKLKSQWRLWHLLRVPREREGPPEWTGVRTGWKRCLWMRWFEMIREGQWVWEALARAVLFIQKDTNCAAWI